MFIKPTMMFLLSAMFFGFLVTNVASAAFPGCLEYATEGPTPIEKPTDKIAQLGGQVTFKCRGYFGCGDPATRTVFWFRVFQDKRVVPIFHPAPGSRYHVDYYSSDDGTELGADLTIADIQADDFKGEFRCTMSSAQIVNPYQTFTVKIIPV